MKSMPDNNKYSMLVDSGSEDVFLLYCFCYCTVSLCIFMLILSTWLRNRSYSADRNTFIISLLHVLLAVYLVLRCAITLDAKVYSAQMSSQSIPADINDDFLIAVHWEVVCDKINKQHWNKSSLRLHGTERLPLYFQNAEGRISMCPLYSVHNLIRLNNCCTAKRRLPAGEKCPCSPFSLLALFETDCRRVLSQLMRHDWNQLSFLSLTSEASFFRCTAGSGYRNYYWIDPNLQM